MTEHVWFHYVGMDFVRRAVSRGFWLASPCIPGSVFRMVRRAEMHGCRDSPGKPRKGRDRTEAGGTTPGRRRGFRRTGPNHCSGPCAGAGWELGGNSVNVNMVVSLNSRK